jgi:hypothetical protein
VSLRLRADGFEATWLRVAVGGWRTLLVVLPEAFLVPAEGRALGECFAFVATAEAAADFPFFVEADDVAAALLADPLKDKMMQTISSSPRKVFG